MKRVNNITSVLILSAIVCFSCTKEDKALTIADQEAKIESFITSRYPNNAVIRNNGSNRIIVDSCYKAEDPDKSPAYLAADTVAIGDTLRVFYAGYIFTSSPSTLFATNVETLATDAGFTLTDQDFSAKEIAYLPGVLISGLEKGFSGMREGEHCLILFSAKEGYYDKTLFNIPKMSALAYEIWVDEVIKKR